MDGSVFAIDFEYVLGSGDKPAVPCFMANDDEPEKLPFKRTRVVWEGYHNLDTYLHELLDLKKAAIAAGLAEKDALDLMGESTQTLSHNPFCVACH